MNTSNNDFNNLRRRPSGMTVPDHFFDDFKASMEEKIDAYEAGRAAAAAETAAVHHPAGRLTLRRRFILWTSVAACMGLLVGLAVPVSFSGSVSTSAATEEYAEAEVTVTQEQLEQDMMLAQLSDYDIFEYYYSEEE